MWAASAKANIDIPLNDITIKENQEITITKGINYKYAIWHSSGIFDLPEKYVTDVKPFDAKNGLWK